MYLSTKINMYVRVNAEFHLFFLETLPLEKRPCYLVESCLVDVQGQSGQSGGKEESIIPASNGIRILNLIARNLIAKPTTTVLQKNVYIYHNNTIFCY
jgi:hypothetical protein